MKTLPLLAAGLALAIAAPNPAAAQFASTGDGIFGNFYGTDRNVETQDATRPKPQPRQPLAYQAQPKMKSTVSFETPAPVNGVGPWTPSWKRVNDEIVR
ncbi:hypothetical protein GTW51_18900 [Aurantimonas aggregata]|uniref:Uncharacterized protein n=1 Tax=Aurantimonas aggregata TaxID=2047720 RepID=A0A6L9MLQ5_9HYPH|nr:hypothetical protein [Aurantimonas aggregata]NDV88767.1 hypothetical protein [Aurantimonas aggregata]